MKRGGRAQVQTGMVEFIGSPFPFSSKLKIWLFSCEGTATKCTKKRDERATLLSCSKNPLLFDALVAATVLFS